MEKKIEEEMSESMRDLLEELKKTVDQLTYVKPGEIPNIDLYMDQVLGFINERMLHLTRNPKEDKIFTKTMINNYVKTKILPPPVKKKYSKNHMLMLLFIYYFKGVLSVEDTGELLGKITKNWFESEGDFGLEDIYMEVFQLEEHQIEVLRKDMLEKFQIAEGTFEDAPEESQEFLKIFSFICLLSFDVFVKKLMIEKLVDGCCKENENHK